MYEWADDSNNRPFGTKFRPLFSVAAFNGKTIIIDSDERRVPEGDVVVFANRCAEVLRSIERNESVPANVREQARLTLHV